MNLIRPLVQPGARLSMGADISKPKVIYIQTTYKLSFIIEFKKIVRKNTFINFLKQNIVTFCLNKCSWDGLF